MTKTLSALEVVKLLLAAKTIQDVFPDLKEYKKVYKSYAILVHPDRCKEKNADKAMNILNTYYNQLESGTRFTSDGIGYKYAGDTITIEASKVILDVIERNWTILMSLKGEDNKNFQRYLPKALIKYDDSIEFTTDIRCVPLHSLGIVEQVHVNWILSRMLELAAWFNQIKNVNCGFNPDTIFVVPENHGIICTSFIHMTPVGHKLSTISGKFSSFYPNEIFKNKQASTNIDVELSKRTALWLLGDKSGVGNVLRKTHDQEIINFLQKGTYNPYDAYVDWRAILKRKFEKKFHPLNV